MDDKPNPVFYTASRRRWRWFRGSLLAVAVLLVVVAGFVWWSLGEKAYPNLPQLQDNESAGRQLTRLETTHTPGEDSTGVPAGFREHKPALHPGMARKPPVRAGFYVNWDAQSYQTLRDHIGQLTMVMPEWFFVDNRGQLATDVDARADSLLHRHPGVAIVPMISNFFNGNWRGQNVHRLLNDAAGRRAFIGQVLAQLDRRHYQGVNIDFEELNETGDEPLIRFMQELYAALHPKGYLVTIDVTPMNEDYNLPALRSCVDYVCLMAYDEHFSTSAPGPVAPYPWIEYVLEQTCKQIPSEQVILGVAGYGYDWTPGAEGVDITYQQAMVRANRRSATPVRFDNQTYSLSFRYADDRGRAHSVWFNDAASAYNVLRASADYETAGVALWRLGSEDPRTWTYFGRDLSVPALTRQPMDWHRLEQIAALTSVDFQGEGDILDVQATPRAGRLRLEYDPADQLITEETYLTLPTSFVVAKVGKADKTIALSFDDGPDETWTPQILAILKREHVPASFFVIGLNAARNLPLLAQMAADGYEIGNHTTTHPDLSTVSPARLFGELNTCRRIIESITGRSTILFRPPYNADAEPETPGEMRPIALAEQEHYYAIGESIDPLDWQAGVTPAQIVSRIDRQKELGNILLLHDAGGDRSATVAALPQIIRYYRQRGYHFATLSELVHRPASELMPPARVDRAALLTDATLVRLVYYGQNLLAGLFIIGTALALARIGLVAGLAIIQQRLEKHADNLMAVSAVSVAETVGLVSVIVPGYNEELNAVRTVESVLASDYPNLEVIFVDDGSRDNTLAIVQNHFADEPRVRVLTKPNGGKASALNVGLDRAGGNVLVCIDADTQLLPDAIRRLVAGFADEQVGAVAGNVRVGNAHNLLTRFQSIEYATSQNFDRRAYAVLNCITVVPGAIGAFRRSAMLAAGRFTTDTLAEDCDLTIRILRAGYRVTTANRAVAVTEAPETVRMLLKQRVRWCYGIMQTVWKHRDLLFRSQVNGHDISGLGWLALPSLVLFQFGFPLLTLLAECQLAVAILLGTWSVVLGWFVAFLLVDTGVAALAYRLEGRSMGELVWLLPQRMVWRYLLFWVLLRAYANAIRGEIASWGVLKRTGRVRVLSRS